MSTLRALFKSILLLAAIVLFSFFSLSFGSGSVHASTGLSIQPIKISETVNPGQTITGSIFLNNVSDSDVKVSATVQDFIPVAGAEGLQFVGRAPGVTTVRDWITIQGDNDFLFKKDGTQTIKYTIAAPKDAEPGSHFGVIFFKASDPKAEGTLKIGTQVGVLVLVTIPGEHLQKGNILEFSAPKFVPKSYIPFNLKFENTGTVYFEPKGEITITNMLGKQIATVPIEGQIVLPTGIKDLYFEWRSSSIIFGRYKAVANVKDGDGNILTSKEIVFYAAPLWYIGIFFLCVIGLYIVLKIIRKHVRISFS